MRQLRISLFVLLAATAASPALLAQTSVPPPSPSEQSARGWLGVVLAAPAEGESGVLVRRVLPESPAQTAGVASGDVIASVDGESIESVDELVAYVGARGPGTTVVLGVGGASPRDVPVTLGARPSGDTAWGERMVGQLFPDIPLRDLRTGEEIRIAGESATPTLVEFWATWCGPCHQVLPELVALRSRVGESHLRMVSISSEDADSITGFLASNEIPWQVVSDPEELASGALLVDALPSWYLIDTSGRITGFWVGLPGSVEMMRAVAALDPRAPTQAEQMPPTE